MWCGTNDSFAVVLNSATPSVIAKPESFGLTGLLCNARAAARSSSKSEFADDFCGTLMPESTEIDAPFGLCGSRTAMVSEGINAAEFELMPTNALAGCTYFNGCLRVAGPPSHARSYAVPDVVLHTIGLVERLMLSSASFARTGRSAPAAPVNDSPIVVVPSNGASVVGNAWFVRGLYRSGGFESDHSLKSARFTDFAMNFTGDFTYFGRSCAARARTCVGTNAAFDVDTYSVFICGPPRSAVCGRIVVRLFARFTASASYANASALDDTNSAFRSGFPCTSPFRTTAAAGGRASCSKKLVPDVVMPMNGIDGFAYSIGF
mmetsp:Transcript_35044/g.83529  ORF Transcript_35044/g.83529 Transcript_35044/m.83529 type:complete len:320 (-) Transcript_35044:187-1146(-)